MAQLSQQELAHLLAPVPLPAQQRDQPVRVNLRPGLSADYVGPVELADLRLQLSPWHWLRAELAQTPGAAALAAEVRAAGLNTVAEAAKLLAEQVAFVHPGDPDYWGRTGSLDGDMDGFVHFIHPALRLVDVLGFVASKAREADEFGEARGLVALQLDWGTDSLDQEGILAVWGNAPGRGFGNDGSPPWLKAAGSLLLADPATGEWTELTAHSLPDEEADELADDSTAWRGQRPRYEAGTVYSTDEDTVPAWLAGGLRYAQGHLYRADNGQQLTLGLYQSALDGEAGG